MPSSDSLALSDNGNADLVTGRVCWDAQTRYPVTVVSEVIVSEPSPVSAAVPETNNWSPVETIVASAGFCTNKPEEVASD